MRGFWKNWFPLIIGICSIVVLVALVGIGLHNFHQHNINYNPDYGGLIGGGIAGIGTIIAVIFTIKQNERVRTDEKNNDSRPYFVVDKVKMKIVEIIPDYEIHNFELTNLDIGQDCTVKYLSKIDSWLLPFPINRRKLQELLLPYKINHIIIDIELLNVGLGPAIHFFFFSETLSGEIVAVKKDGRYSIKLPIIIDHSSSENLSDYEVINFLRSHTIILRYSSINDTSFEQSLYIYTDDSVLESSDLESIQAPAIGMYIENCSNQIIRKR